MSLAINSDNVEAILLKDGKWYRAVANSNGLCIDAYEYMEGKTQVFNGNGRRGYRWPDGIHRCCSA